MRLRHAALSFLFLAAAPLAHADAALQTFLEQTLAAARDKDHLPAVAALVQIDGKIEAEAALGLRALGHKDLVTTADRWHIGSDTKAFTATLIGRLADQGVVRFDDTLEKCFPAFASEIDPAYRNVTVAQLLSHTAGLPPLGDNKDLPELFAAIKGATDIKAERATVARHYLSQPQASKRLHRRRRHRGGSHRQIVGRPHPGADIHAAGHQERKLRFARHARPNRPTLGT